jgi:signal transduction histidine kinase
MLGQPRRVTLGYVLILLAAFTIALAAGWTTLASRMDRDAYDWMSRHQPPPSRRSDALVLAFDEETLSATGGLPRLRAALAEALEKIAEAQPAVVAIDLILHEPGERPADDQRLAAALRAFPKLVLATDLLPSGRWEDPLPLFRTPAAVTGHVHAAPDPVSRVLPLELASGQERKWAMALEAARLRLGTDLITETPSELELADIAIPARRATARQLYIRYRSGIRVIPIASVIGNGSDAQACRNRAVFIGVTAQSAARDRLITPLDDQPMSGVEIHAQAYETIIGREFLRPATLSLVVLFCAAYVFLAGCIFVVLTGWAAYAAGGVLLLMAHAVPHLLFGRGIVFPYLAPVWAAWLSAVCAASWQYFVVRRQLRKSESDRARYQQAIHFVTHEMRSPLTAIQGSSELMGRYNLTDDKRKQMAQMINSESKRLAKMIQTFLDIERLTDGQMEIRTEPFSLDEVLRSCLERARPLSERKQITLKMSDPEPFTIRGDRELMEYAIYNLLTNAVKYSPAETSVIVSARSDGQNVRLSVTDEGIGMDEKELRSIFQKFYRTKKAEASGEAGTGIGLSLVQQIVTHHHGRMEVTSAPGKGSCFTMVLPAVSAPKAVSQH